jgi:hypothetical protein
MCVPLVYETCQLFHVWRMESQYRKELVRELSWQVPKLGKVLLRHDPVLQ